MRAAVITQPGKPWQLQDLPDPQVAAGQVLIRVHASGICGTDIHVHEGHMPCPMPIVAGHEPVGEIVAVGLGVTALKVGDRVGVSWVQKGCNHCRMCQERRPLYCRDHQTWMHLGGGNAELMLAWAEGCTLLPAGIAYEEAAPIFCAGQTVMSALRNVDARPGERIAILGIGGLGHLAIQYASALGLEVVALTGSEDKVPLARQLGADEVVVVGDDAGKALADAGGADIVINTGNSAKLLGSVVSGLRPDGRIANTGVVDGPIQFPDQHALLLRQVRIVSSLLGGRRELVEALELVARRKVKPWIETYSLGHINDALERLAAGKVRFRAVIQMAA